MCAHGCSKQSFSDASATSLIHSVLRLVWWFHVIVSGADGVSHLASPPARVQTPDTEGDRQIDSIWVKESSRCERDMSFLLCGLERCTLLGRWPLIVCRPAPQHVNIHFLHPVQLQRESTNVQRDWEGSQEPCSSNLFPCQLPTPLLEFDVIHLCLYISSSTSFSLSLSLSFFHPPIPPIYFFFSHSYALLWKEDAWFMKLYFYQLLRRKRGEKERQRQGEKRRMGRRECEERTRGEGGQENVEETSITLRPLGWKWRREVGWDRNMMDLTKIMGDVLQSTWVVYCYTLDTFCCLVMSLISHISLCACNIFCQ